MIYICKQIPRDPLQTIIHFSITRRSAHILHSYQTDEDDMKYFSASWD